MIRTLRQFINDSFVLVLPASTRSLYERKLQKLLDNSATQLPVPEVVHTEVSIHHNGTADPDLYSDKEDGKKIKLKLIEVPLSCLILYWRVFHDILLSPSEVEPRPEPQLEAAADPEEPAPPVVGRPLRSRGKSSTTSTPSSSRTSSSHHHTVGIRFNKAKPSTPCWCLCIFPSCQCSYGKKKNWWWSILHTGQKHLVFHHMEKVVILVGGTFRRPTGGSDVLLHCSWRMQSLVDPSPMNFTLLLNTLPPGGEGHC